MNKLKDLIILLLIVSLSCGVVGYLSNKNAKQTEPTELEEGTGEKQEEQKQEEIKDEVVINYPSRLSDEELTSINNDVYYFSSEANYTNNTIEKLLTAYTKAITPKNNTSAYIGNGTMLFFDNEVKVNNGTLKISGKTNIKISGLEGTVVSFAHSCLGEECDMYVMNSNGDVFYFKYTSKTKNKWTFKKTDLYERPLSLWNSKPGGLFLQYYDIKIPEFQSTGFVFVNLEDGIHRLVVNDGIVEIEEKVFTDRITVLTYSRIKPNNTTGISLGNDGRTYIVEFTSNDYKYKELKTKDGKSVEIAHIFTIYNTSDSKTSVYENSKTLTYIVGKDNYLYYYAGGEYLELYSNSKVEGYLPNHDSSNWDTITGVQINFEDGSYKEWIMEDLNEPGEDDEDVDEDSHFAFKIVMGTYVSEDGNSKITINEDKTYEVEINNCNNNEYKFSGTYSALDQYITLEMVDEVKTTLGVAVDTANIKLLVNDKIISVTNAIRYPNVKSCINSNFTRQD